MKNLFCLLPALCTALAAFLLHRGLASPRLLGRWFLFASLLLLILIGSSILFAAVRAEDGGLFAFIFALPITATAVGAAIWLALTLPSWHKLAAVGIGLLFPMLLMLSIQLLATPAPETITRQHGDVLIQALERYAHTTGSYPDQLTDLVPTYLPTIPEATTTQGTGWLYHGAAQQFILGFWYWPEKYSSWVCLHQSGHVGWECRYDNWGPFSPVSTPQPG
jgi:hypothetical protein